jgi:NCS1 nucleoside transporter family
MTTDPNPPAVIDQDVPAGAIAREGAYGEQVIAVEPGGAEFIPLHERHGRPVQLFWTWASPNLEFATVFVGVLAVAAFGLNFWQATAAILAGSLAGAISHAFLSSRGPRLGVPQMVQSRLGFGYWGNILPAGINAVIAGVGWFAVNSVSGTFALNTLTHLPEWLCLVIIVALQIAIAFFGHNLVHAFERYAFPVLAIIFLIATGWILAKAHPGFQPSAPPYVGGTLGGFLLTTGAVFGYAVGWNPYASDYTRYFPARASRTAIGLWAGLGLFVSCGLLEIAGAAAVTISKGDVGAFLGSSPTGAFTGHLPTALADATLLAIALGAIAANVLNIYSGALSFVALGIKLPLRLRRAIVAVVAGTIGFVVALLGLHGAVNKYENFLLIIAYWIAPWLAVFCCDWVLRRGRDLEQVMFDRSHSNWAGPVAMAAGMGLSIWLFSNQTEYVGLVPAHVPAVGDITFEAGFFITAVIYLTWHALARQGSGAVRPAR